MPKPNSKIFLSLSIIAIMYGIDDSYAQPMSQSDATAIVEPNSQQSNQDINLPSTTFETIVVIGHKDIMQPDISAHDVYDKNESSTYKTQEDIERFIGESPADIFRGMVGVQSGDARNSGALDPNIRGIQGQGRVPVTIDGTEQAITANRGYQGASNRNYIDPLLISDVKVSKGASMQRGVHSSVGGAVTINTLRVGDVLDYDQSFGLDFKVVAGNNTTKADAIDPNDYVGDNASNYSTTLYPVQPSFVSNATYRNAFLNGLGKLPRTWNTYTSPGLIGKSPKRNEMMNSFEDTAYRIAMAGRGEYIEGLFTYTYRDRGNYFAGASGSEDYRDDTQSLQRDQSKFAAVMADVYRPKQEVPNTSNQNESYLVKATFKPNTKQALQLGYRRTMMTTGDIMPFRVADDRDTSMYAKTGLLPQWPLSRIDLDAYNISYKWQPENRWIDLDVNLWHTDSNTQTHNSGGDPLSLIGPFNGAVGTHEYNNYKDSLITQFQQVFPNVVNCPDSTLLNPDYAANPNDKCTQAATLYQSTFVSNSLTKIDNQRTGISLSNNIGLTQNLDVTIAANYQQEELVTNNSADVNSAFFAVAPGEGRRRAGDINISAQYRPYSWLDIQAGVRYDQYWAMDDYVNEQRAKHDPSFINQQRQTVGITLDGFIRANDTVQQALQDYNAGKITSNQYRNIYSKFYNADSLYYDQIAYGINTHLVENGVDGTAYVAMPNNIIWYANSDNSFDINDNPYANGKASQAGILRPAKDRGKIGEKLYRTVSYANPWESVPAQEAWGWSPSLSASLELPWDGRLYARYAESYRMPSMFESISNFSKNLNYNEPVQPERGANIEVGYVHDFRNVLLNKGIEDMRFADAKLVYYHNQIDNVIDRDLYSNLHNFDKQTISGLELQSRMDTGDYFANFSAAYTLDNQVCDSEYAVTVDPYYNQVSDCVDQGFFGGFLFNMAQPKYTLDLTLGTRLLDEKLELGTRIHHHSSSLNDVYSANYGDLKNVFVNIPYSWSSVTTMDYYIDYEIFEQSKLQFAVTNATNEYYLDPLSRTLMPAPGRAARLSFTTKF